MEGKWGVEHGEERIIEGANMVKVHFVAAWNCQDETPYYVQFNV
jgi:hypothetical protein